MIEERDNALKIISTATLLIEQETEPSLAFLGINLDTEFYQGKYLIQYQINHGQDNYLVIEAKESNFLIEMVNGNLVTALGIEEEDVDYWQQLESKMYVN